MFPLSLRPRPTTFRGGWISWAITRRVFFFLPSDVGGKCKSPVIHVEADSFRRGRLVEVNFVWAVPASLDRFLRTAKVAGWLLRNGELHHLRASVPSIDVAISPTALGRPRQKTRSEIVMHQPALMAEEVRAPRFNVDSRPLTHRHGQGRCTQSGPFRGQR